MLLPTQYDRDLLGIERALFADLDLFEDHEPRASDVYSLVSPPIGFFPIYENGFGDSHGVYWPFGCENEPPIVAFGGPNVGSFVPQNSNVESFVRCQLARDSGAEEYDGLFRALAEKALGRPPARQDNRGVAHDDFQQLLSLDPQSPFYLCALADIHLEKNEPELAEQFYRRSLAAFSEYVAAHFGLACALRRQRRAADATIHLRNCLLGPMAFYGASYWGDTALPGTFRSDWHRKALMWLQRSSEVHESLRNDPFLAHVHELKYQSGLANNPDLDVFRTILDEYAGRGRYDEAARVWQLVGYFASHETTSFRERYQLNPTTFGMRLAELFERSGNQRRSALVKHMLSVMDDPEGLRL